uniref:Macaca fascicularis brain cDNA, clone: QflA-16179 n=1 Tax=Macaca fascicularis TaxID=9541 RepID=I7GI06_MACFA|nr:unnamed protein product [Macaca fascicularis]
MRTVYISGKVNKDLTFPPHPSSFLLLFFGLKVRCSAMKIHS